MPKHTKHLKNAVIPHKGNHYRPHITGKTSITIVIAFLIALNFGAFKGHLTRPKENVLSYATNTSVAGLLEETNKQRVANGQAGLTLNSKLSSAAQAKANHMITNNYWAHVAPDGTTPWYFIDGSGYSYVKAGENLAYGFDSSSGTVDGWMNSPSHKANILTSSFKDVGFGIANGSTFQGDKNTVVVAMYAQPTTVATTNTSQNTTTEVPARGSTDQNEAPAETGSVKKPVVKKPEKQVANSPEIVIASPANFSTEETSKTITNFDALLSGSASLGLYFTSLIISALAAVYAYRHVLVVKHLVVKGEYLLHAHPLFETIAIYVALWIVLSSTHGVIK